MTAIYTAAVFDATPFYTDDDIPCLPRGCDYALMEYWRNLKALRKQRGYTQGDLAEMVGVEQPTVQRWENGKQEPSITNLEKLASSLGTNIASIFSAVERVPLGPQLYVKGSVAAGLWRDCVEDEQGSWTTFTGRDGVTADPAHRFGLRIIGDSMNECYPPGTIVECVSLFGRAEALPGKKVVVVREREDGLFESTVKELVDIDGELWLRPRSSNPIHQAYRLASREDGIVETRISAVVVSSVRPE